MPTQSFYNDIYKFIGRIDQSLVDLNNDVGEIKMDQKSMREDIDDLKAFKIRVMAWTTALGFFGGALFKLVEMVFVGR